jgi:hypothetical protein
MSTESTTSTSAQALADAQASSAENLATQTELNNISQNFQTQSSVLSEMRDMAKTALKSAQQGFSQM